MRRENQVKIKIFAPLLSSLAVKIILIRQGKVRQGSCLTVCPAAWGPWGRTWGGWTWRAGRRRRSEAEHSGCFWLLCGAKHKTNTERDDVGFLRGYKHALLIHMNTN